MWPALTTVAAKRKRAKAILQVLGGGLHSTFPTPLRGEDKVHGQLENLAVVHPCGSFGVLP